jgi:hypothetical protein
MVNFVSNPNNILIAGNHDVHYKYPYRVFRCSGYEDWKYYIINDIVNQNIWNKLKWYYILDDKWLLTHAGLHRNHLPEEINMLNGKEQLTAIGEYLDNSIIRGLRDAANNKESWILSAGKSRGGFQKFGGITWVDWNSEFIPTEGLHQIVGHSPQTYGHSSWLIQDTPTSKPYFKLIDDFKSENLIFDTNKSYNLCLDVWKNMHYAIWNGNKLSIHSIRDI